MSSTPILITLDGGAGAGKSTTATELAKAHHLLCVDTGSHYRAVTHSLLEKGADPTEETSVSAALETLKLGVHLENFEGNQAGARAHVALNGQQFTNEQLRSAGVNAYVSQVAALPPVRNFLKAYQRSFVQRASETGFAGVVMEGRDIGSVIFPEAKLKFFLAADASTRQARRDAEGQADQVALRDAQDAARKTAPLKLPEGAIGIDTGAHSVQEVVDSISAHIGA